MRPGWSETLVSTCECCLHRAFQPRGGTRTQDTAPGRCGAGCRERAEGMEMPGLPKADVIPVTGLWKSNVTVSSKVWAALQPQQYGLELVGLGIS